MVMIKSNFTARGAFGGVYFKNDGYGQHIQAMPRNWNRDSTKRMPLRKWAWTAVFNYWKMLSALLLMLVWVEYAHHQFFDDPHGVRKKLTNSQWFAHFNVNRILNGLPPYTTPPRTPKYLPAFTCTGGPFNVVDPVNPFRHIPTTGNWYQNGYYNYQPVYETDVPKLKLWYDGDRWIVSYFPGNKSPGTFWTRFGDGIEGRYIPDESMQGELEFFQ